MRIEPVISPSVTTSKAVEKTLGGFQEKLAAAQQKNKADDELKQACRDFEAVLVSQMLRQMRATVPKTDFFGSDETEDMFQGMLDDENAKNISQTSSFGLAEVIYSQLAPKITAKVPEQPVDRYNGTDK